MLKEFADKLSEAVNVEFPGQEKGIELPNQNGSIQIDINAKYYHGRLGHKDTDTIDISGYSTYTDYKRIYRRISLESKGIADIPEIIEKVKVKVEEMKKLLEEACTNSIARTQSKKDSLESIRVRYGADKVAEAHPSGERLTFGNIQVVLTGYKDFKVNFWDEEGVEVSPELIQRVISAIKGE